MKGRIFRVLVTPIVFLAVVGGTAPQYADLQPTAFAGQILAEHNRARDDAGVPRLSWSNSLARDAAQWAEVLADEGRMRHASHEESAGAGENLWMGSAGRFAADSMVGTFVSEKRHYLHGAFPRVSRTGRWEDVGHYTQVVWRDTREVGCAMARGARDDFLVCRYWPAGNWTGQVPY